MVTFLPINNMFPLKVHQNLRGLGLIDKQLFARYFKRNASHMVVSFM